jgi:hypothetical protein
VPEAGGHGDTPGMTHDLDVADLPEVRRRVVDPVVAAMIKPGELTSVELTIEFPPASWAYPDSYGDAGVWLRIRAGDDRFEYRVAKPGFWLDDAAELAQELAGELCDWICCETSFGWAQVRSRPEDNDLPGPPATPPDTRAISVHFTDNGGLPLWEAGAPAEPATVPLSPALRADLTAWQNHADALADAAEAAHQPPPRPTTEAGVWVQYVSERSVLTQEAEAARRRERDLTEWHAWVNQLQPTRYDLVRRLREELGPTFTVFTPPRLPVLT